MNKLELFTKPKYTHLFISQKKFPRILIMVRLTNEMWPFSELTNLGYSAKIAVTWYIFPSKLQVSKTSTLW